MCSKTAYYDLVAEDMEELEYKQAQEEERRREVEAEARRIAEEAAVALRAAEEEAGALLKAQAKIDEENVKKGGKVAMAVAARVCLLFDGQGTQYAGMLTSVMELDGVNDLCDRAQKVLGYDLGNVVATGSPEWTQNQEVSQLGLLLAGMAAIEKVKVENPAILANATCMAGFSCGEYVALCAAGVFTFEDALAIIRVRARAMAEAQSSVQCMLSVMGLSKEKLSHICSMGEESGKQLFIANNLFPDSYTIAGSKDDIEWMEIATKRKAGAEKATIRSTIVGWEGAFHSPYMEPARAALSAALAEARPRMKPPTCTVWMTAAAGPIRPGSDPAEIIPLLEAHLCSQLQWMDTIQNIIKEDGVMDFYELGPGAQLKSLVKRIDGDTTTKNIKV